MTTRYRDPRRERPQQDQAAERAIYWLSPHERARRRVTGMWDNHATNRQEIAGPAGADFRGFAPGCSNVVKKNGAV